MTISQVIDQIQTEENDDNIVREVKRIKLNDDNIPLLPDESDFSVKHAFDYAEKCKTWVRDKDICFNFDDVTNDLSKLEKLNFDEKLAMFSFLRVDKNKKAFETCLTLQRCLEGVVRSRSELNALIIPESVWRNWGSVDSEMNLRSLPVQYRDRQEYSLNPETNNVYQRKRNTSDKWERTHTIRCVSILQDSLKLCETGNRVVDRSKSEQIINPDIYSTWNTVIIQGKTYREWPHSYVVCTSKVYFDVDNNKLHLVDAKKSFIEMNDEETQSFLKTLQTFGRESFRFQYPSNCKYWDTNNNDWDFHRRSIPQ